MDKLPDSLLLEILSRLDDSADVARCRVASKAFDAVFPGLRSVRLSFRNINSRYWGSNSFNKIFLDLILKLETVESVSMEIHYDCFFTHEAWLPRVSRSLKSLSMSDIRCSWHPRQNVLLPISAYCHNLVSLRLSRVYMSTYNLNPLTMLTSFTLDSLYISDEDLNELNKCFPNLQILNMVDVRGLKDPKIHHLNLRACHWDAYNGYPLSLTLITPNLITLKIECYDHVAIHVDGRNQLKTFSAYLLLDDPSLSFSSVACVLDQCVCLSEVSLLIHSDVSVTKFERFKSKCMARWPGLKWRWGIWNEYWKDLWITDGISYNHHR